MVFSLNTSVCFLNESSIVVSFWNCCMHGRRSDFFQTGNSGFSPWGGGNSGKISSKTKRTTFPPEEENIKFRKPERPTPMAAWSFSKLLYDHCLKSIQFGGRKNVTKILEHWSYQGQRQSVQKRRCFKFFRCLVCLKLTLYFVCKLLST